MDIKESLTLYFEFLKHQIVIPDAILQNANANGRDTITTGNNSHKLTSQRKMHIASNVIPSAPSSRKPIYGTPQSMNSPHSIRYPKCALTSRLTLTNTNTKSTTNTKSITSKQKDDIVEKHQATEGNCLCPSPMTTLQVEAPGTTKANECSDQTIQNYFRIYSQNIQELRSKEDKLEYILRVMTRKKIQ